MKDLNMKKAFTLAEVLITLAIIGIVAALTIPTLVQNYKKNRVETSLKKFYSVMNQAVILSNLEYGIIEDPSKYGEYDVDKWFKKYITKHLSTIKSESETGRPGYSVVFHDGSGFNALILGEVRNTIRFCIDFSKCPKDDLYYNDGINSFQFSYINNKIVPLYYSERRIPVLIELCKQVPGYCTVLIYMNNWKIPDYYPLKF